MSSELFVYGTLLQSASHPMGQRLSNEAELIGGATICGRLFDFGRMPGLILSCDPTEIVFGEVWSLRNPASFVWLDRYEGILPGVLHPQYERMRCRVTLDCGPELEAAVYVYRWPHDHAPRILSGRWLQRSGDDASVATAASVEAMSRPV